MTVEVVRRREEATERDRSGEEPFVIEESAGYLVNYAAKAFARALADGLAPHQVTAAQWAVLMFLWAEDRVSQTELSRRVAIEDATMVRTLDRMERDGLVRRERDARDRRRSNVVLTEQGRALRDVLVPRAVAVNEEATRSLSAAERRQLLGLLRRLIAALAGEPATAGESA